ncbi:DnaD domain-containing protein [Lentibacillus daqui]|uniref:DnaD domain-containing protein n=1 Tax=Lentibacillus daqui TaxID=2911514 RepID=UPI0022B10B8C|nr:DnaD domain protein [Lentibacillus daqui]
MNYIKEINAFYDRLEREPLSASAINLWYTLMHINNKAMWAETFTASATVLRFKSGLKESSFKRARAELKEKGYIDYVSRPRNQAPVYRMVSLSMEINGNDEHTWVLEERGNFHWDRGTEDWIDQPMNDGTEYLDGQDVTYASTHRLTDSEADHLMNQCGDVERMTERGVDHLTGQPVNQHVERDMDQGTNQNTGTLIKHKQDINQIKQNQASAATDVFVFYQQNFGQIRPFMTDELLHWVNDIGEPLVLEAMKRAVEHDRITWAYVKGILLDWRKKGISSLEDAQAEEVAFRKQRLGQVHGATAARAGGQRTEVVPEWFDDYKRKQEIRAEKKAAASTRVETEEEKAEFEELLAEFVGKDRRGEVRV